MIFWLKDFNPLLIRELNSLRKLESSRKALIFDDINWSEISREQKIHLLDKDRSSDIRVLHDTPHIPSDLIKVVTSNNPNELISLFEKDVAIDRRIKHVLLKSPLFTVNNFIQNNITITLKTSE